MPKKQKENIRYINHLESLGAGSNGRALLHQIVKLLQQLLTEDEPSHIDLRTLPLNDEDMALLLETLGDGEIYAEQVNYGVTRIRQTGIPGVWWVVHLDEEEQTIAEFIEINYCPEALIVVTEDVRDGREALQARLFEVEMARKRGE
jgi:hydrogenase-1 operon protein HyaF